jgi:predicted nucleotidyltransferase
MKELSAELLDEIARRLAASIHPERIYLFGSHAAGDADQDSNIDLLAVVPDTDRSTREIAIEGKPSLNHFLASFDLIVCTKSQFDRYAGVKNTIMNEVLCDGRLVYGPQA